MVEDRVTDGKRIAQLLASELTGLETGPLSAVAVSDADPDAEPTQDGTTAYTVTQDGEQVGEVLLYPDRAVLRLRRGTSDAPAPAVDSAERTAEGLAVTIESGAAVKRAVDVVRETLG